MAKMKTCKSCGQQIAKSADVCPNCGAKQRTVSKTIGGILLAFVILGIIGVIVGSNEEPHKVEDGSASSNAAASVATAEPEKTTFEVGDKVELNDVVVTLVDVRENNGGNYMTPEDGKVFVVCEFEIENNTAADIAVSSLMSFEAYIDDYSTNLSLTGTLSDGKSQLDGTIAAGKKMNGVIGYEADSDWSTIEIHFKADFWSNKDFAFEYSK